MAGLPYGHFGDGCVHVRIDLPLDECGAVFRRVHLRRRPAGGQHGGSCSGEHGDGRARSELLPIMYSPAAIDLFAGVKALFDPDDLLNPGVLVRPGGHRCRPAPPAGQAGARPPAASASRTTTADFTKAVHRCVGIGKCRADNGAAGGFMCPSYLASRDEKDVTRGRARVLQELTNGTLIPDWSSEEVHESLDLCLSCKACASDCPAGVDMAQYKSEVLHRTYRGKRRPISHYSLGWLPRWISDDRRVAPGRARAESTRRWPTGRCPGCCSAPAASTRAARAPTFAPPHLPPLVAEEARRERRAATARAGTGGAVGGLLHATGSIPAVARGGRSRC